MHTKQSPVVTLIAALAMFALGGCAGSTLKPEPGSSTAPPPVATASPEPEIPAPSQALAEGSPLPRQQIIEIGTGEYVRASAPEPPLAAVDATGDVNLRFQNTDLREFIKVILGDTLGVNFAIDSAVSGQVTLETAHPITRDDVLPLLEEILAMHNAALVRRGDLYQVVARNTAARGSITPTTRAGSIAGYQIRIIPLRFIAAQEMQKILEPLTASPTDLRIDKKRNLIIVAGTADELTVIEDTIGIFDVDWLRGMSVGLYPLEHVDPATLKIELDEIIRAVDPDSAGEPFSGLVRIVAIERLYSILLIGTTPAALREVELWVHRLDRPSDAAGRQLFVYRMQNAKATELADILGQIFRPGGTGRTTAGTATSLAVIPPGAADSPRPMIPLEFTPTATGLTIPMETNIEIIADDVRNALVILATTAEYRMVETALRRLDVVPMQVLIEASIVEVTLRDDLSYGVEWFFKNNLGGKNEKTGRGVLDLGVAGLNPLSPSFSYTVVDSADEVRAVLNALANESRVNVLSSPSLMVLDNQKATINVGDEIPVPTRQSISNLDPSAPTVNEIQFRKTGITLDVTPRVSNSGLVTMEIKQEVATAVATTSSAIDAPTIRNRAIQSVVAVDSGDTIVLGGLIQNTHTANQGGIPGLHRLPVIGALFGQTNNESARTELLILITPRVVRDRTEAKDATDEMRRKLRGLDDSS